MLSLAGRSHVTKAERQVRQQRQRDRLGTDTDCEEDARLVRSGKAKSNAEVAYPRDVYRAKIAYCRMHFSVNMK